MVTAHQSDDGTLLPSTFPPSPSFESDAANAAAAAALSDALSLDAGSTVAAMASESEATRMSPLSQPYVQSAMAAASLLGQDRLATHPPSQVRSFWTHFDLTDFILRAMDGSFKIVCACMHD
jgi:hypothetical protein